MKSYRRDRNFMSPAVWGEAFWDYMFLYGRPGPETCSAEEAQRCFEILAWFVPCKACRIHFKTKLKTDPVTLPVFKWVHRYKNEVNARQRRVGLRKPDLGLKQAAEQQRKLNRREVLNTFHRILKLTLPLRNPANPHPARYTEERTRRMLARLDACTAHCVRRLARQPTARRRA